MQFILRISLVVIITIFTFSLIFIIWINTKSSKLFIESFICNKIEQEIGYKARIDGFDVSLPLVISSKKITLDDDESTFIEVDDFHLNIVPSLFSLWKVAISDISANNVILLKKPLFRKSTKHKDTEHNLDLSFIPNISIESVSINKIILSENMTGFKETELSFKANMIYNSSNRNLNFISEVNLLKSDVEFAKDLKLDLIVKADLDKFIMKIPSCIISNDQLNIESESEIDLTNNKIEASIKYSTTRLIDHLLRDFGSEGTGVFEGKSIISGSVDNIDVASSGMLTIDIKDKEYFIFPDMQWEVNTVIKNNHTLGDFEIKQGGFTSNGKYNFQEGVFRISDMISKAEFSNKHVNLTYNSINNTLSCEAIFNSYDIKDLQEFFPFIFGGDIKSKVSYEFDGKNMILDIEGSLKNYRSRFFNMSEAKINLISDDLSNLKIEHFNLGINHLINKSLHVKELKLDGYGKENIFTSNNKINIRRPYIMYFDFDQKLSIKKDKSESEIKISALTGAIRKTKISSKKDILITIAKNIFFDIDELIVGRGNIVSRGIIEDQKLDINCDFKNLPGDIVLFLAYDHLDKAEITGNISLVGTKSSPFIKSSLKISNILTSYNIPDAEILMDSNIDHSKVEISLDLLSKKDKKSSAWIKLPILFTISPFNFNIYEDKEFSAGYIGLKPLNTLCLFPMPLGHGLRGYLDGKILATGTLNDTNLNGDLVLYNGKYNYKRFGIKTKNISAKIHAREKNVKFNDIKIYDYFQNVILGNGEFVLNKNMSYTFDLSTQNFNLINSSFAQGKINGALKMIGDSNSGKLSGEITVDPFEIKIPTKFDESISSLNITKIIEDESDVILIEQKDPYKLLLDVIMKTGKSFYVRGWGVSTMLVGQVQLKGDFLNPTTSGKLNSENGKYEDFGKQLDIKQGELIFDGEIPPSPYLNIIGATNEDSVELRLILEGPITAPKIRIDSIPAMNQEEALSMLLFGSNPDNISPFQAFQLAKGMKRIADGDHSDDAITKTTKAIGIDQISFKNDSKNPQQNVLGVGKHLSDKVFFEVEQGIEDASTKTKIELELSPKFTIEGSTENTGNSSVGFNLKLDY